MEHARKKSLIVAALLALGGLYPVIGVTGPAELQGAVTNNAELFNQREYRNDRRDYQKAMQECIERRANGEESLECPDINDPEAVQAFLRGEKDIHGAAKKRGSGAKLTVDDLSSNNKAILRRYQRINTCNPELDAILPGFYELCQRMIVPVSVRIELGRNARAEDAYRNQSTYTLEDLIKMKSFKRPRSYKF